MKDIEIKRFFSQSDADLFKLIKRNYMPEVTRLTRAYAIRTEPCPSGQTESPSQSLFKNTQHDEVNRTVVSVLALRWIYNNNYEKFVDRQPEAVKLGEKSFEWLHNAVAKALLKEDVKAQETPTSPDNLSKKDVETLVTSVLINDLGKDPQFAEDYRKKTGQGMTATNHDMILLQVAEAVDKAAEAIKDGVANETDKDVAELIPSFSRLEPEQRKQILQGLRLGSFFNFGQLAQAENAPASLEAVRAMNPTLDDASFQLHVVEQLLDVAGAAGHADWTSARKLIEPILEAYCAVHEAVTDVMHGKMSPRQAYDTILEKRKDRLCGLGFRQLSVNDPKERALLRILCMGGVVDLYTAELYSRVWDVVGKDESLVKALNIDGSVKEPAVQPTYMPALLAQAVSSCGSNTAATERALTSALRYLARVMYLTPKERKNASPVMERNVLDMVRVVQSPSFHENPEMLERENVPIATPVIPT